MTYHMYNIDIETLPEDTKPIVEGLVHNVNANFCTSLSIKETTILLDHINNLQGELNDLYDDLAGEDL